MAPNAGETGSSSYDWFQVSSITSKSPTSATASFSFSFLRLEAIAFQSSAEETLRLIP
jgi:hypothetical protein